MTTERQSRDTRVTLRSFWYSHFSYFANISEKSNCIFGKYIVPIFQNLITVHNGFVIKNLPFLLLINLLHWKGRLVNETLQWCHRTSTVFSTACSGFQRKIKLYITAHLQGQSFVAGGGFPSQSGRDAEKLSMPWRLRDLDDLSATIPWQIPLVTLNTV